MNRYRSTPGLGPQKATTTTTCQKCLKKGHYSYECKATLQDRPYASRPSRSQQLQDPKLAPKLTSAKPDDLLETKGVADKILAEAEAKRNHERRQSSPSPLRSASPVNRRRSCSTTSISTISTNISPSRSPQRHSVGANDERRDGRPRNDSVSRTRGQKRRHDSLSSASYSRSPSPHQRSRPKNRRHRLDSPDSRGRPVPRRGSHRSPSRSPSLDQSRVTRHRKSLESRDENDPTSRQRKENVRPPREDVRDRGRGRGRGQPQVDRRSLSPYSRRLALTQAMNMDR